MVGNTVRTAPVQRSYKVMKRNVWEDSTIKIHKNEHEYHFKLSKSSKCILLKIKFHCL